MLRAVELPPQTLDSRTSAFWAKRALHLAELGMDLEWDTGKHLHALLRITSACMDTTVAIAVAYLRGTEHWASVAAALPTRLRHSSLGEQTRLIRDLNELLPPSLRMELSQPAPELNEFARKMLPKNTPRSGAVTLLQGLEALVAWRNLQVHPTAHADREEISYDEAEKALLAVIQRTPALGLRLFYGTGFGTADDHAVGMCMTLLSWPGSRPYRKGQPIALPSPLPLHHVLAMVGEGQFVDLHPFLTFDGAKLSVFQSFSRGSAGQPGGAMVWHPKTQAIDKSAGAELNALFRDVPQPTTNAGNRAFFPSNEFSDPPASAEVRNLPTHAGTAQETATLTPGRGSPSRHLVMALGGAAVVLVTLMCIATVGFGGLGAASGSGARAPFSTPATSLLPSTPLLSAVSNNPLRWGDSLSAVVRAAGGRITSTGRGTCNDEAWRHLELPSSVTPLDGVLSVHAWIDSEVGLFELDVFTDPARQSLAVTKATLQAQLGLPRAISSRRYTEPVYRWDRGAERLNTTLTTRTDITDTVNPGESVIVRVLNTSLQTRATAHLHAACPDGEAQRE